MIALSFIIGITVGSSSNVIAQQPSIPNWIKNTALWWGQGQISDTEFIKALQYLIGRGILVVPQSASRQVTSSNIGISIPPEITNTVCKHPSEDVTDVVEMTGYYNNMDNTPYSQVSLKLGVIDQNGNVAAVGDGVILNIGVHEIKVFDALANYNGTFQSCTVQIEQKIP